MDDELEIELHGAPEPPPPVRSTTEGLVVVSSAVLAAMDAHVAEDTSVEHGGVMVGHVDEATGATVVTGSIRAVGSVSEVASLTFTHETWDHISGVMESTFPDRSIVGWYHSHPHFGIFLSSHDQFIHQNFFGEPWQVAYVRDPLLDQRGFFCWVAGEIHEVDDWQQIDPPDGAVPSEETTKGPAARSGGDGTRTDRRGADSARPERPSRRRRTAFWIAVLVVGLVGAVVAGTRVLDSGASGGLNAAIDPAEDRSGAGGEQLAVATVSVVDAGGDARLRLNVSPATSAIGSERLPMSSRAITEHQWEILVAIPVDARPGTYNGHAFVGECPATGRCVGNELERSENLPYQFEVVEVPPPEPATSRPSDTTAP